MKQSNSIPTVPIYGIPFSNLTMQETVQWLTDVIEKKQETHVITANPIMVMAALDNTSFMQVMNQADLIVPDGSGVVWAANVGGQPLKERVTGFDLLHELMKAGETRGYRVYLLGASPDVIQAAHERLHDMYPGVQIVGSRDGFFGPAEDEAVVSEIALLEPDILFVARGADTQEPWIAKYRHRLNSTIMMGVGGSFDVISGRTKRAPKWVQNLKLEWFYRLVKEPKRFLRMLALPKFAWKVMRDKDKVTKTKI
ncbi:WecB/TagA/CpsF family glycosyltransferase [Paenibacillus aquistagni]|uniref:N-acetylglucosaminyldiphosphoundecaprenol N-acetyl-beta-D-mannosaminyltransferase n=1 Tax=Paenibacillus aquistagni TaxID=1852522 RepID=A0A1X7KY69_9BACL|nr:WecB/TagA/CpsF family glycosyltransferase [Paenibacillus aquistagni]SMG45849.1 N-acetylglucosaminyldiphosphoundecaprenol N-acetyl-beta-D-mannosaminyltransferase [Paenibacillus aquistagni]